MNAGPAYPRTAPWDVSAARALLAEIRRRAESNAAHVASTARSRADRELVDDVLLAAWAFLRRHGEEVLCVARPWAYLLSSAQTQGWMRSGRSRC